MIHEAHFSAHNFAIWRVISSVIGGYIRANPIPAHTETQPWYCMVPLAGVLFVLSGMLPGSDRE